MASESFRLTTIRYEVFFANGRLYINPSLGVSHRPIPSSFKVIDFPLPSNTTQYGGIVYQDFERLFEHAIGNTLRTDPGYQGIMPEQAKTKLVEDFTKGNLAIAARLLKTLDADVVARGVQDVLQKYDELGLPRNELYKQGPFSAEQMRLVASQYAEHLIKERLSQPLRRVSAFYMRDLSSDAERKLMKPIIVGHLPQFLLPANSDAHPIAKEKANEFAKGLEAMVDDRDFKL